MPAAVLALATGLSACAGSGGGQADAEPRPKVAFFEDLSIEDPLDLVSPSFLALEAGLSGATGRGVEAPAPVQFDTGGDPAAALASARLVAADPAFVAVVVAPFWAMPEQVAAVFAEAGLPVIGLSDAPRPRAPDLVWRRLVAPAPAQARTLAARAASSTGDPVCVVAGETPRAVTLAASVAEEVGSRAVLEPGDVRTCGAVVWTGGPAGAAALVRSLDDEVPFLVGDGAKAAAYLDEALSDSDGTVAVCPCVDVTTATDLAARRFVNGYQAATGLAPGVFAAEGWDVAAILEDVAADAADPADRAAYLDAVRSLTWVAGVGGRIRFDARGEPTGASSEARVTVAAGRRWVPAG
jgi:ABC-type branched-subunit amino acid transport system substrate-binding protein